MGNYVTVADLRAEGVPVSYSDALLNTRITKWESIVEKITRNVFRQVDLGELTFDGNNYRMLHFNLPIITVTSLKINNSTVALDPSYYRVYNGREYPADDRGNPKIELVSSSSSVFTMTRNLFARGYEQKITATWGYVEDDGLGGYQAPIVVKDCIMRLVIGDLSTYYASSISGGGAGVVVSPIRRERTDGHEIEYQMTNNVTTPWGLIPKDIYDQLMLFRAPIYIGLPDVVRYSYPTGGYQIIGW